VFVIVVGVALDVGGWVLKGVHSGGHLYALQSEHHTTTHKCTWQKPAKATAAHSLKSKPARSTEKNNIV